MFGLEGEFWLAEGKGQEQPSTRPSIQVDVWQTLVYSREGLRGFWRRASPGVLALFFSAVAKDSLYIILLTTFFPRLYWKSFLCWHHGLFLLGNFFLRSLAAGSSEVSKVRANMWILPSSILTVGFTLLTLACVEHQRGSKFVHWLVDLCAFFYTSILLLFS